jgi:hypothetical protein
MYPQQCLLGLGVQRSSGNRGRMWSVGGKSLRLASSSFSVGTAKLPQSQAGKVSVWRQPCWGQGDTQVHLVPQLPQARQPPSASSPTLQPICTPCWEHRMHKENRLAVSGKVRHFSKAKHCTCEPAISRPGINRKEVKSFIHTKVRM